MSVRMILKAGYGYFDTTEYPYGGSFRRAAKDTSVAVVGPAGRYPKREREVIFEDDGRKGVVPVDGLVDWGTPC